METAVILDRATTIGVYEDMSGLHRYEIRVTVTRAK